MQKSESIANLAQALSKAQADILPVKKTNEVNFGTGHKKRSYKYAELSEVMQVAKDALYKNELSFSQFPISSPPVSIDFKSTDPNEVDSKKIMYSCGVETILMHSSGEWISDKILLNVERSDPQSYGSAITYARRYAIQSILGIPTEDDDAQSAMPDDDAQSAMPAERPRDQIPTNNSAIPKTCACGAPIPGSYLQCFTCYDKKKGNK